MSFNILLVDDSATMRSILARSIDMAGVPVGKLFTAPNGQKGLEVMDGNWIDLVFLDINMPVMDGITMIEKMAENHDLSDVPVVVVSTEGSRIRIDRLRDRGVKGFVSKPFTPETIREVIRKVVGNWDEESSVSKDAF
jgi:two-component system chemotaxis response regulator CheY